MQVLCPTCHGRGSIPDPAFTCATMNYCGPNGQTVPHTFCRTCGGSGWIWTAAPATPPFPVWQPGYPHSPTIYCGPASAVSSIVC